MHTVAVLALESSGGFDLSVVTEVFGSAYPLGRPTGCEPLYDVGIYGDPGARNTVVMGVSTTLVVETPYAWADAVEADTVVVLSPSAYTAEVPAEVQAVLREAHARGARIVSFCNGAFVLAATGLLDGRRSAVHWTHTAEFAARYPQVRADAAVLYVDDGDVVTTAGGAAGVDVCLHLVRRDHGAAVAAETAKHALLPLHRSGEQAQFIEHAHPVQDDGGLETLLRWMEAHLDTELTLSTIAEQAATSIRTLNRWFRAHTGTTPIQWLIRRRLQRAQELLETTDLSVEEIASRSGFGSAVALRQHFRRTLVTTPTAHRRAFTTGPV
ncbi:GlxA family transcriptional regulator [Phytoactinopolyspora endophytica]|uniref:GlxA family transcriptional regulator n=1 Tax=Phytoactinopolyspora endophytica TaxID=1642495 RepID=UPI00101CF099|nr:helix-turn-helix domain-containing protein [Phytoactinopolyspora endophytica]